MSASSRRQRGPPSAAAPAKATATTSGVLIVNAFSSTHELPVTTTTRTATTAAVPAATTPRSRCSTARPAPSAASSATRTARIAVAVPAPVSVDSGKRWSEVSHGPSVDHSGTGATRLPRSAGSPAPQQRRELDRGGDGRYRHQHDGDQRERTRAGVDAPAVASSRHGDQPRAGQHRQQEEHPRRDAEVDRAQAGGDYEPRRQGRRRGGRQQRRRQRDEQRGGQLLDARAAIPAARARGPRAGSPA